MLTERITTAPGVVRGFLRPQLLREAYSFYKLPWGYCSGVRAIQYGGREEKALALPNMWPVARGASTVLAGHSCPEGKPRDNRRSLKRMRDLLKPSLGDCRW